MLSSFLEPGGSSRLSDGGRELASVVVLMMYIFYVVLNSRPDGGR